MENHYDEGVILIIDDNPTNLNVIVDSLEISGFKTITARNGTMGIKRAIFSHPDLILLDVMMPDIDGFETCRRLKAEPATQDIPVIFITALNDVEHKVKGFEMGGVDYITKPIEEQEVLARVHTHLELQRARKSLETHNRDLIDAARLREDVERIIRHDLKTPLNAVIAYPQLILRNTHLTEAEREHLKTIETAGYRMLRMINRSLDLVKMERGMYQFKPVTVNLVQVLGRIAAERHLLIHKKSLKMEVILNGQPVCDDDIFSVLGEDLLCYSMLANLITNAINASPEGDVVTVSLAGEETAIIRIHNTGSIDEEIRDRFFEKYVTSRKDARGTGLGTYSAKLMADTQNGAISMTTSEHEGTTITIRLPKGDQQPFDPSANSGHRRLRTPQATIKDVLTSEALTALPAEWLTTLQQGAEIADLTMLTSVINQIRERDDTRLADALQRLIDDFEYDEILDVIREAKKV